MTDNMTIFTENHIKRVCIGHGFFLSQYHIALPMTRYGTKYSMAKHKHNPTSCGLITIVIGEETRIAMRLDSVAWQS